MNNKGFIVVATMDDNDYTDLHIEDIYPRGDRHISPDDSSTDIVSVWIAEAERTLTFTRDEAKDFMNAMGIIVDRYEITPEEWEAQNG